MYTRRPKWFLLLFFIFAVIAALTCQSAPAITISRSFDLPIPSLDDPDSGIGMGNMADAVITVNEHIQIIDLNIAVSLVHESFYDLEIALESPAGTTITLNPHSNAAFMIRGPDNRQHPVGGSNRFLFDDKAAICIEDATPPFDASYRPATGFELAAFNGQDAFGNWRLQIDDVWIGHTGLLEGVELIITTPEPATAGLFAIGACMICLLRNRNTM